MQTLPHDGAPEMENDAYFSMVRRALSYTYRRGDMHGFLDAFDRIDHEMELEDMAAAARRHASALESIAAGLDAKAMCADIDRALADASSRNGAAARGMRLLRYWSALAYDDMR